MSVVHGCMSVLIVYGSQLYDDLHSRQRYCACSGEEDKNRMTDM